MFFGDKLSAADAAEIGLVNRVVPDDELSAVAGEWAAAWPPGPRVDRSPPSGWSTGRSTAIGPPPSHDEALAQDLNMTTHDAQEGVASFVERRDPDYRGW